MLEPAARVRNQYLESPAAWHRARRRYRMEIEYNTRVDYVAAMRR